MGSDGVGGAVITPISPQTVMNSFLLIVVRIYKSSLPTMVNDAANLVIFPETAKKSRKICKFVRKTLSLQHEFRNILKHRRYEEDIPFHGHSAPAAAGKCSNKIHLW
jgi:hypothetical protein